MKSTYLFIGLVFALIAFTYGHSALMDYRGWVKESTVKTFKACMVFEREAKGEEFCLNNARNNNQWSPYPLTRLIPLL